MIYRPAMFLGLFGALWLVARAMGAAGAETNATDLPAPAAPAGRPTREELRERVKNLPPEERRARLNEFLQNRAASSGGIGREAFEQRRQQRAALLEEIKDLPPLERQAKLREFRERGSLLRPGVHTLNPEEQAAKRKEFQGRVSKELATLRAKKARNQLDEEGERSLQRMEGISKRLAQIGQPKPGELPLPAEKPSKPGSQP